MKAVAHAKVEIEAALKVLRKDLETGLLSGEDLGHDQCFF
jgi:hypothetical protein